VSGSCLTSSHDSYGTRTPSWTGTICPSQDNSAPPLDPSSLPNHIGTIPASTKALLRAELHPLDIILPHSHAIPLSFFYFEPPTHCHWPFPSLSSLTPTGHLGPGLLYNRDPFALGSLIPDDGGSMHLWNVGRQSFYVAVHPRRQFWTKSMRWVDHIACTDKIRHAH
jgi:hypothetical protein